MKRPLYLILIMLYAVTGMAAEPVKLVEESGIKGGLVVHLGCGDGTRTAALRINDRYLVHGLDSDSQKVAAARKSIQARGLYGAVSVDTWNGKTLPYSDNLVNLIIAEDLASVTNNEIQRVLAPHGVALIKTADA